jgi:hypothetical protein
VVNQGWPFGHANQCHVPLSCAGESAENRTVRMDTAAVADGVGTHTQTSLKTSRSSDLRTEPNGSLLRTKNSGPAGSSEGRVGGPALPPTPVVGYRRSPRRATRSGKIVSVYRRDPLEGQSVLPVIVLEKATLVAWTRANLGELGVPPIAARHRKLRQGGRR